MLWCVAVGLMVVGVCTECRQSLATDIQVGTRIPNDEISLVNTTYLSLSSVK
jgi:hypothetical protein